MQYDSFTASVLPLHGVCVRGLECAADIDLSRHGSLGSSLAAVDIVHQSSALWFSLVKQVLKQHLQFSLSRIRAFTYVTQEPGV